MSDDYQTVARVGEIPEGQGRAFEVAGKLVAVFQEGGEYFAIDDTCPHMGASLATGQLLEGVVTCCWHAWRFCIRDGSWADNPKLKVASYDVRVEGDAIQVKV